MVRSKFKMTSLNLKHVNCQSMVRYHRETEVLFFIAQTARVQALSEKLLQKPQITEYTAVL